MPKSKRDKKVSLTKTEKRTSLINKQVLAQAVRTAVEEHNFVFVYGVLNMRNTKLKILRNDWNDSRFFMGKTKVMKFGLGLCAETEAGANLSELANCLDPQCGLLFTNRSENQVVEWFNEYREQDFARAGSVAPKTVTLAAGPMEQFSFAMETHLRTLGLPTRLDRGIVHLITDFTVCNRGEILRPDQTKILKLLGLKLSVFRVNIKCCWNKSTGQVSWPTPPVEDDDPDIIQDMDQDAADTITAANGCSDGEDVDDQVSD